MKGDRTARVLAATALGVALLALVLAGWAVWLGQQYRQDVRLLGESITGALRVQQRTARPMPLERPPPQLAPEE